MIQTESSYTQLGRYETTTPPETTQNVILVSPVGDVHLWGIILPKILLENNGVKVIWAPQCIPERLVGLVKNHEPKAIVITALLTSSRPGILDLIKALNQAQIGTPVILGGIAISKKWVDSELIHLYKGDLYSAKNSNEILEILKSNDS